MLVLKMWYWLNVAICVLILAAIAMVLDDTYQDSVLDLGLTAVFVLVCAWLAGPAPWLKKNP